MKSMTPKGFTIVETLVAITILLIALIAPFRAAETSLTSSYTARDELIANSLAQEGLEYVHQIRGSNYLLTRSGTLTPWLSGLTGGAFPDCQSPKLCTVDMSPTAVTKIAQCYDGVTNTCGSKPLYVNGIQIYSQAVSGTASKFYRTLTVCYIGGGSCTTTTNEAKVTVTVTWSTNKVSHTTSVNDYVTNWL